MKAHPFAELLPLMSNDEFAELKRDLGANGYRQTEPPIMLLDGMILDGRNRYRACCDLGIDPPTAVYEGDDPIGFVVSRNVNRRHLNKSQWAMVGARTREAYDRQAKERLREAQERGRQRQKGTPVNLPESKPNGDARDAAAKAVGVSGRTIDHATKVIRDAVPEIVAAVKAKTKEA